MERTTFSVLLVVCLCHFLNDTMQSMLPAIYPILKQEFALTFVQVGVITLVLNFTSSIVQPIVGLYADGHHHYWQLSVGMFFTLTGIFLLSMASGYAMILTAITFFGCGTAIFHPQASQVAQVASGGRKGLAQSIFQVGGNAGYAVGPLLAAAIILPQGLRAIHWLGVIAVAAAVILYYVGRWYVRALKTYKQQVHVRWTTVRQYSPGRIRFFVLVLFVLMFSKNFYTSSMTSYYTFFLIDKFHVSISQSQVCLFIFLAAQAVGTVVGGMLGDKYGRKYVIWFSILGAAPFTMALPYVPQFWMVVALTIVIGLIIASAFASILVFATDLMPAHTAMVAGLFYGLSFGLGGLGSAIFGWVAEYTSVEYVFKISTVLPLLGICAIFLPKMQKQAN